MKKFEHALIRAINKKIYEQREAYSYSDDYTLKDNFIITGSHPYICFSFRVKIDSIIENYIETEWWSMDSETEKCVWGHIDNVISKFQNSGWYYTHFERMSDEIKVTLHHRVYSHINEPYRKVNSVKPITVEDLGYQSTPFSLFISAYKNINYYTQSIFYNYLQSELFKLNSETIKVENFINDTLLHLGLDVMYHLPLITDIYCLRDFNDKYESIDQNVIQRTFIRRFQEVTISIIKYSTIFKCSYNDMLNDISNVSRFILWHSNIDTNLNERRGFFPQVTKCKPFDTLTSVILSQINKKSEITKIISGLFSDKLDSFKSSFNNIKSFSEAWNLTHSMLMDLLILANSVGIDNLREEMDNKINSLKVELGDKITSVSNRLEYVNKELQSIFKANSDRIDNERYEAWKKGDNTYYPIPYWEVDSFLHYPRD